MDSTDKKELHHAWRYVRAVKPWYLAVAFVLLLSLSVLALRNNYQNMVALRQAVYTADERAGDVEGALKELRTYVYAHMNTDLATGKNSVYPPIQLKYTYERLVAAEQERVKGINETIYSDAQAYCEQKYPQSYSGGPRVPCIKEYVTSRGVQAQKIPDSLYKFDFVSPFWSADLAGWLVLATVLVGFLLVLRIGFGVYLRRTNVI